MQSGPWPASITEKQQKLPARVELNSNHSAEGKNVRIQPPRQDGLII
jgi:hypothetical protein